MRPVIEPYSIYLNRRERTSQRISWLIAAGLVSVMLWFCGWLVYQGLQVEKPFGVAYERVVSAVSGR